MPDARLADARRVMLVFCAGSACDLRLFFCKKTNVVGRLLAADGKVIDVMFYFEVMVVASWLQVEIYAGGEDTRLAARPLLVSPPTTSRNPLAGSEDSSTTLSAAHQASGICAYSCAWSRRCPMLYALCPMLFAFASAFA